jgi:hypothetical protein
MVCTTPQGVGYLFAILAAVLLAQCASSEDDRFRVGASADSFVIIGVAEAQANAGAQYRMLWRRVGADGRFMDIDDDDNSFEAITNARGTLVVRGIPGEFKLAEIEPGTYALDSVFGVLRDRRVNYVAQGLIEGPDRPSFEVRPGEAIYLGIWQVNLDDTRAVATPWRLDQSDLQAVMRRADEEVAGNIVPRETRTRAVPCDTPLRLNNLSQRRVC